MAADFDKSFAGSGYQLRDPSQTPLLQSDYLAFFSGWSGGVVAAGETTLGGRRTRVQMVSVQSIGFGSGFLILARIEGAPEGAQGTLHSSAAYGLYGTFAKLPLPLRIVAATLGPMVGPIMAPGMAFFAWLANRGRRGRGLARFPQLAVSTVFRLKYGLWGRSEEEVRRAFPPRVQSAILERGFTGTVAVGPDSTRLELSLPLLGAQRALDDFLRHDLPAVAAATA